MKKALVILMALSMVFAAFADEPAVKNEIAEFTGSASVTWGVDLDAKKTGFQNDASANLKFTLISSGDKSTTGDGVWGELKIKYGDAEEFDGGAWGAKTAAVDFAKIHLNDMIAIGITAGDNLYGGYKPTLAVFSDNGHFATDSVGGAVTQGITVEVALPDLLNFNLEFRSKPQYQDNYGIGAEVALKAVENLNFSVGFGIDLFGGNPWGLAIGADYKLGLSDTMYLKPQGGYSMTNADNSGKIAAALLLGWGDENQDTNIKYISKKVSDGFSIGTEIALDGDVQVPLCVGIWDSKFVENLKAGVQFHVNDLADFALNTLAIEFAYDLGGIKPAVAFAIDDAGDLGLNATKLYVGVDFTGFVDNTTFTLAYESADLANSGLGTINLTAKISF